jgi:hypothetical protein
VNRPLFNFVSSCAVGSATAGRDRHFFDASQGEEPSRFAPRDTFAAAASAPFVSAARVDFVSLAYLASLTGLTAGRLFCLRPYEWCVRRDFVHNAEGFFVRVASLSYLVGELSTRGEPDAARRLMSWLCGGTTSEVKSAPRVRRNLWFREGSMA